MTAIHQMESACSAFSLESTPCFLRQKLRRNNATFSPPPASSCFRFRSSRVAATYSSAEKTSSPPHLISSKTTSPESLYEILGVPNGATCREIKAAYRRLARIYHPDAVASDRKDSCAVEFIKIHSSYSTLADPQKRADYDRDLFIRQRLYRSPSSATSYAAASAASSMHGFSRNNCRNWETDQCW